MNQAISWVCGTNGDLLMSLPSPGVMQLPKLCQPAMRQIEVQLNHYISKVDWMRNFMMTQQK